MKSSIITIGCHEKFSYNYCLIQMQCFDPAQHWVLFFGIWSLGLAPLSGKCSWAFRRLWSLSFISFFEFILSYVISKCGYWRLWLTHFPKTATSLAPLGAGLMLLGVFGNTCKPWWLGVPFKLRKKSFRRIPVNVFLRVAQFAVHPIGGSICQPFVQTHQSPFGNSWILRESQFPPYSVLFC